VEFKSATKFQVAIILRDTRPVRSSVLDLIASITFDE
jgi:hypothetical protein